MIGLAVLALIWAAVTRLALSIASAGVWTLAAITLLLSWISLIGLLMLTLLNGRATAVIQLGGISVGFMGVRRNRLDALMAESCEQDSEVRFGGDNNPA